MIGLQSPPNSQAEGLCHNSRRHRPRNVVSLEPSRPVRALQPPLCVFAPLRPCVKNHQNYQTKPNFPVPLSARSSGVPSFIKPIQAFPRLFKVNNKNHFFFGPKSPAIFYPPSSFLQSQLWKPLVAYGRLRKGGGGRRTSEHDVPTCFKRLAGTTRPTECSRTRTRTRLRKTTARQARRISTVTPAFGSAGRDLGG
jgi:hypothetical protein